MTQRSSSTAPHATASSRFFRTLLRSPLGRRLGRSLVMLRIRGRNSGALFELPVQYAPAEGGIVVVPARPETKQWWRNLRQPSPIEVMLNGTWHQARAVVLAEADDGHSAALGAYAKRWPRASVPADAPIVLVTWIDERDLASGGHPD